MSERSEARIKTKVSVKAVKIHGPNSPDVISGKVLPGHRQVVEMDEPEQYVELTESQVREQFGDEIADQWFKKGGK